MFLETPSFLETAETFLISLNVDLINIHLSFLILESSQFLQGYIFSLLSSIFIGMAVVEHDHH